MDLSSVYSKTPKGLRARASLIGGLSSQLMKVLTHVDGSAKAETILLKFEHLTPQQLSADLSKLMQEGYIRLATVTVAGDNGWALTTNFAPMVVEEYISEEELDATTQAKTQAQLQLAADLQAKQSQEAVKREDDARLAKALKANKKAQKLRAKEKSKAEIKVKAQLAEEQRIAMMAEAAKQVAKQITQKKAEAEAKLLAEQAKIKAQLEADKLAKQAEEAQQKAELKAREAAEQAQAEAEQKATESARREIDRIAREAEEAQRKLALENKVKLEAEQARLLTEQAQLEAKCKLAEQAEQAEQAKLTAAAAANMAAEAKLKEKLELTAKAQAKEIARLEIASIVRKAEEDRKQVAAKAKEEKLEIKRKAKAEQEAQIKAEKALKEQAKQRAKAEKIRFDMAQLDMAQLDMAQPNMPQQVQQAEQTQKKQAESARFAEEETRQQQAENIAAALFNQEHVNQDQAKQEQTKQAQTKQAQTKQAQQESNTQHLAETIRANLDAEQQAAIVAKENARLEMERIGREAEVMRQLQQAEHYQGDTKKDLPIKKLPMSDDFDAAEAAEEAAFEAEELAEELAKGKYPAETEKKLAPAIDKTTQQAKEDADRAHIKQAAEDEVAQREQLQSRRLQRDVQSHVSTKRLKKIAASLVKLLLVYTPIALVFVIGLLHFVNISMLIKPIEQIATNAFGAPVTISKVHASVWPQPHLVLEDVTIGADGANQKIQVVNVLPVISALFDDVKVVKSLVIDGINIQYANFSQALIYINKATSAKNLKIEQINLKNLTLNLRDLQLAPFDGKLTFNDSQTLKSIDLVSSNDALSVTISPQGGSYSVSVKASNWTLPLNPKIVFSALNAEGIANQNKIEFNQITGEIYGGNLTAKAIFNLPQNNSQWTTTGSFSLVKADTALLLTAFNSAVSVAGKLNLNGNFSCQSARANQLAQAASVAASFDISQGSIGDIELVRAVMARGSQSLAGDATDFNRLTGTVKINQGQYQYAKLVLVSPQFRANGYLNINANEAVTGKINADLAAQSRRLQATFSVTGRGKDLKSN